MWTANRSPAKVFGFAHPLVNGRLCTGVYVIAFHLLHEDRWWIGGRIGLVRAAFVLLVVINVLPDLHPRTASEHTGPTAKRQLEPPGFWP